MQDRGSERRSPTSLESWHEKSRKGHVESECMQCKTKSNRLVYEWKQERSTVCPFAHLIPPSQ